MLASKNCVAHYSVLRTAFITLVRSKMDYGSIIYDSGKNIKKILDPINNAGALMICGAFRTSPITSLLCEARLPSLEQRRRNLTLNYAIKAAANSCNPVQKLIGNQKIL